jgi:prepilin signal peptidase PulO-like enzyme (type II secretory pathway)
VTVNAAWVTFACLAAGAAVGLAWAPLVPVFGHHSEEALDQPRWTRLFGTPLFLAGVCAALFAGAALRLDAAPKLAPGLLLCAVLVGITAVDLRYRIIPNRVVVPAAAIGYAVSVALAPGRWLELLVAALVAGLFMLVAAMVSPSGLGLGDVKLTVMLGLFLGRGVAVAVMGGLLAAAVPSIALMLVHGIGARKMTLALGPYLALGGVVALLFGHDVLHWYWSHGH